MWVESAAGTPNRDQKIRIARVGRQDQGRGQLVGPAGADENMATALHGVGGVENKIEQHLLEKILDEWRGGQGWRPVEGDFDVALEAVAQQADCVLDHRIEVVQGHLLVGGAAESKHGADDPGALVDDGFDAVDAGFDLFGVTGIGLDDLGRAFDDGEDVCSYFIVKGNKLQLAFEYKLRNKSL